MSRALVLNAGASWGAYQVGALRHLVAGGQTSFDVCAGTGLGAMNAAFVACGQLPALEDFWSGLRLPDLVPRRRRRFLAAHLSEAALAERGTVLLVTAVNLQTGRLEALRYPGGPVPLVDAVLAGGALPGATRPVAAPSGQLVEGTIVDAVPMAAVLEEQPTEVVAVLPMLPPGGGPPRRYGTWGSVLRRAIEVNQAEDARQALAEASVVAAEGEAHRRARQGVLQAATAHGDPALVDRLTRCFDQHQGPGPSGPAERETRGPSGPAERETQGPDVRVIRPSRPLEYPMWRFRRSDLMAAAALGERDAGAAS